jgi:hypothetical protein
MPTLKGTILERTGKCLYCGRYSHSLIGGYCSPVCDSKAQIYGDNAEKQKSKKARNCLKCGKEYIPYQDRQKFCSPKCRSASTNQRNRDKVKSRNLAHPKVELF